MEREYFSIEENKINGQSEKWIHFHGYTYYGEDQGDGPYRNVEYTFLMAPLLEVLEYDNPDFGTGISGWYAEFSETNKQYIQDLTEEEFEDLVEGYYGISVFGLEADSASPGEPLSWSNINMNTPYGKYYGEGVEPERLVVDGIEVDARAYTGELNDYFKVKNTVLLKSEAARYIHVSKHTLFEPEPGSPFTWEQRKAIDNGNVWRVAKYYETDSVLGYMGFEDVAFGFNEVKELINAAAPYGVVAMGAHANFQEALNSFEAQSLYASAEAALEQMQDGNIICSRSDQDVER